MVEMSILFAMYFFKDFQQNKSFRNMFTFFWPEEIFLEVVTTFEMRYFGCVVSLVVRYTLSTWTKWLECGHS